MTAPWKVCTIGGVVLARYRWWLVAMLRAWWERDLWHPTWVERSVK